MVSMDLQIQGAFEPAARRGSAVGPTKFVACGCFLRPMILPCIPASALLPAIMPCLTSMPNGPLVAFSSCFIFVIESYGLLIGRTIIANLVLCMLQGPHPSLFLRPKSCNRGINLGSFASFHFVSRRDNFVSLKHRLCLSAHPVLAKKRTLMVLSFKGNQQNDGSDSRHGSSRFAKAPFQLYQTKKEIEETSQTTTESFDAANHLSLESQEREDSNGRSLAIQKLFRRWLIMLTTQTSSPKICEAFEGKPVKSEVSDCNQVTVSSKALKLLQVSFMYFLRLDASISLPVVIFIPWFLTIRIVYGAEVTKELTPLWIIGPLVLALYINIIKGLCSLYAFFFIQTVKLVKNLPAYCHLLRSNIAEGKLQSTLWFYLIKPFSDIKNMDRKEFFRSKLKLLQGWAMEKYLDFIESIWPFYCRTIRFLKRANLI